MNDYLDILSDVVLLATFQPRARERIDPSHRLGTSRSSRTLFLKTSGRRMEFPERL